MGTDRPRARVILLAACLAAAVAVAGCGGDEEEGASASASGSDTTEVTLRLNWVPYAADHAVFYYGKELGLYEEAGIDLDIGTGNGSATTLKLIANGSNPLGLVDASTMLKGIDAGTSTVKAVYGLTQTNPMAFIFKEGNAIDSAEALRGKTVGLTQGDATSVVLPAVLNAAGLSRSDVSVRSVANPAGKEAALLRDQVDALTGFFTEQPLRLEATQDVDLGWLPFSDLGVNTLNLVVIANTDWLAEDPELARRFADATRRSAEATAENPQAAADAIAEAVPNTDVELALQQIEASVPLWHTEHTEGKPYGWMAENDWQQTVDILNEHGDTQLDDVAAYYSNAVAE